MPDMTPVADQIIPPNPQAGLNAYSSMLGIQQQKLALQTGEAALPGVQAKAQQAQQENQELQALHQFTHKAMSDPAYFNPDGSPNVQKFQQGAMSVAGTYGQQYIGQATSNFNESVRNRKALLDLSNDQRQTIGQYMSAVAAKNGATTGDYLDAIEQARGVSSDSNYQRSIDSFLMHTPNVMSMPTAQASATLRQYARSAAIMTAAPGAAESVPAMGTVQGPQGIQPVQTSPQSPLGIGPQGAPFQQGVAPQVITQPGTQAPGILHPSGNVTGVGNAGQPQQQGTNWWNPPPGAVQWLHGTTGAIVDRANSAIQAANNSPMAIDALSRARALLDSGTWTGGAFSGFRDMKNLASSFGMDTSGAQNMSELTKNLARYEAARAASIGNTDAARALTAESGPNTKFDTGAAKNVVLQSLANERALQAIANLYQSSPNPQIAAQREQAFRSVPHLFQTYELGLMRNKKEADEFMERYGISGPELAKSAAMLRQMGAM